MSKLDIELAIDFIRQRTLVPVHIDRVALTGYFTPNASWSYALNGYAVGCKIMVPKMVNQLDRLDEWICELLG